MSEQEVAERFGHDSDDLLRRTEPPQWDDAPPEYAHALDLARALAARDGSGESQRRVAIRQQLVARAAETWEREARCGFWNHPLVALPLALVTLALVCALVLPSSAGWVHIGHPGVALPAIETPVAAAQTAYAELRGFGAPAASPTLAPTTTPTFAVQRGGSVEVRR